METASKRRVVYRKVRNFLLERSCGTAAALSTSRNLRDDYDRAREKVISKRMTQQLRRCPKRMRRRFLRYSKKTRLELIAERKRILKDGFMILSKPLPVTSKRERFSSRLRSMGFSTRYMGRTPNQGPMPSNCSKPRKQELAVTTANGWLTSFRGRFEQQLYRYAICKSRSIVGALTGKSVQVGSSHLVVQQNPVAGCTNRRHFLLNPIFSRRKLPERERHEHENVASPTRMFAGQSSKLNLNSNLDQVTESRSSGFSLRSFFQAVRSGIPMPRIHSPEVEDSNHLLNHNLAISSIQTAFGKSWLSWLKVRRSKYYRTRREN